MRKFDEKIEAQGQTTLVCLINGESCGNKMNETV